MARTCTCCARPDRDAIDAALRNGASLDEVVETFGLPSRSALQRHRAAHLGRVVTLHLPPAAGCAPSNPAQGEGVVGEGVSIEAELERILNRAVHGDPPSVQCVARVAVNEVLRLIAAASIAHDGDLMVRALRELRGLIALQASVTPERMREAVGWEPPQPRPNPLDAMLRLIMGPIVGMDHEADTARAELDAMEPGWGSHLAADWNSPCT